MQEEKKVFGLTFKADDVSELLKDCFSKNLIDMDEYEKRIALVHAAESTTDLDTLISDIPPQIIDEFKAALSLSREMSAPFTIKAVRSVKKYKGKRLAAKELSIYGENGIIKLDFRDIEQMPSSIVLDMDLRFSTCRIIVPPGTEINDSLDTVASISKFITPKKFRNTSTKCIIHVKGTTVNSIFSIKVKKSK